MDSDRFQSWTLSNDHLNLLVGHIVICNDSIREWFYGLDFCCGHFGMHPLLCFKLLFEFPRRFGIGSLWSLYQIHCAQRAIQQEAKCRLRTHPFSTVEMLSVAPKYHRKGYGCYLIGNALKNMESDTLLAFTATPNSVRFYEEYGFKRFVKVFVGVELTFHGFLYHPNEHHLDELIGRFPKNYTMDLSLWHHLLPHSIVQWIMLLMAIPFIILWTLCFVCFEMLKRCF